MRRVGADKLEAAVRELESAVAALRAVRGRHDERARGALDAAVARVDAARRLVQEALGSVP